MVKYKVPFYANTEDDMHCVQACFKMILKHFLPDRDFGWQELDKMTHQKQNKGTWWMASEIALQKMGFRIRHIDPFDYTRFLTEGKNYFYQQFGSAQADWYIEHSNILEEQDTLKGFVELIKTEVREATLDDFESLLSDGFLLMSDVNANALVGKRGYTSHAVVIYGFDKENLYVHDPGLPPQEALGIKKDLFRKVGGNNLAGFKI